MAVLNLQYPITSLGLVWMVKLMLFFSQKPTIEIFLSEKQGNVYFYILIWWWVIIRLEISAETFWFQLVLH